MVSDGIGEHFLHFVQNGADFQRGKPSVWRLQHADAGVGRSPDLGIGRSEKQQAACARRGSEVGDAAVVSDEKGAAGKDGTQNRQRKTFQERGAVRREDWPEKRKAISVAFPADDHQVG